MAEECLSCAACVAVCAPEALRLDRHRLRFTAEICTGCAGCLLLCPTAALQPVTGRFYRETV